MRKRVWLVAGVTAVAGAAGFVVADRPGAVPAPVSAPAGAAEVRRVDIADRQWVAGTLGHADSYTVRAPAPGVLTALPALGTVVARGGTAYEVDGRRVVLLLGTRPVWRELRLGVPDGADVAQLETNLVRLGLGSGLTVDRHFSRATRSAVRRWQRAAKLTVTGTVPLGQVVFQPAPVRIGAYEIAVGARVGPGQPVLLGTSDRPAVTVHVPPALLPSAAVGDPAVVNLPDGTSRPGSITAIGGVTAPPAEAGGPPAQATAPVTIRVDGAVDGFLDQAPVRVAITVARHDDVLAVPITALNVVAGGSYEVVDAATGRRTPVRTGLFDETAGLVEVSGAGLAEGQRVRVPDAD